METWKASHIGPVKEASPPRFPCHLHKTLLTNLKLLEQVLEAVNGHPTPHKTTTTSTTTTTARVEDFIYIDPNPLSRGYVFSGESYKRLCLSKKSEDILTSIRICILLLFHSQYCPIDLILQDDISLPPSSTSSTDYCETIYNETTMNRVWSAIYSSYTAVRIFTPSKTFVAFNGGKDASVCVTLVSAALALYTIRDQFVKLIYGTHLIKDACNHLIRAWNTTVGSGIKGLYCHAGKGKEFPQVEAYVKKTVELLGLNLSVFHGDIKSGLWTLLQKSEGPFLFFMGKRASDAFTGSSPDSNTSSTLTTTTNSISQLSPTDLDWPPVLRSYPLLYFSYGDIWTAIKWMNIEYCSLYDQGYTSIGTYVYLSSYICIRES